MVIAHVLAPAAFGGLETVVESLSRGQADSGDQVVVIGVFTEEPGSSAFWQGVLDSPVTAVTLVVPHRGYLTERRAVREALAGHGVEVLHTHGYRADVVHATTAKGMHIATVTTVHGFTGNGLKNRVYELLQRRAFRKFDAVVAVSEPLRGQLVAGGLQPERTRMIRNAWTPTSTPLTQEEARSALQAEIDGARIGWVGRLSPEKGPDVMVRALGLMARKDVRLSLVGNGRMGTDLKKLARQSGVDARIDWHGEVAGVARYLKAFNALAITSWTEGTPMILFEAMAADVPVVATRVGGIPDVVSEREAVLIEPGDEGRIAEALDATLERPSESRARAEAARIRLGDFAVTPWIERYRSLYAECIHEVRAGSNLHA